MKKIILLCFTLFIFQTGKAQYTILGGDSTNLESNSSFIYIDTASGNTWQIGTPQKTFFGTSYSAPYSIMTDSINSYPINNLSRFTVGFTDTVHQIEAIEIGFWHKYETDNLKDGGFVEISTDSGATWMNLGTQTISGSYYSSNFYTYSDTITGNIAAFTGVQSTWEYSKYHLALVIPVFRPINNNVRSDRDVYTHNVLFRFNFKSDNIQTNKAGWIIDNVYIREYDVGGGIHENSQENFDVQVYPNPINDQGIIQAVPMHNEHDFTINIYNATGQLIIASKMDKNDQYIIHGNDLRSGLYMYSVKAKNGNFKYGKLLIK